MSNGWMKDGRKIPDEAMDYIRKMAVHAVREMKKGPEVVARLFGFSPSAADPYKHEAPTKRPPNGYRSTKTDPDFHLEPIPF